MKESILKIIYKLARQRYVYVGVPVIIQNSNGDILLGKRNESMPTFPGFWGLPGGMPEYGEKLVDTAMREVKEELGVDVKIIKTSKNFYENLPSKINKTHSVDIALYAKIVKGVPKAEDETMEVKWFKPSEIRKMKLAYGHKGLLQGEGLI